MKLNMKNILIIAIILFAIISLFMFFTDSKSYSINDGLVNVTINDDGSLHIHESYVYDFHGTYNGVKRNIPLRGDENIVNMSVQTENAYSKNEFYPTSREYNITTYLYNDANQTEKISDKKVTINYDYDMEGVIRYNEHDKALFNYKLKGNMWEESINGFTAYINYPSQKDIIYYINPYEYNSSYRWDGSTLVISTNDTISDYLEVNSLIPKNQLNLSNDTSSFDGVTETRGNKKVYVGGTDYEAKVIEEENTYISEYEFGSTYFPIMMIILLLSLLVPVGIYYKYGREPIIDYDGIYEREPPSDDSPAFVNAICSNGKLNDVGSINDDAFKATIMDLIDRKYLDIIHNEEGNMQLKVANKNLNGLKDFEFEALNIIRSYERNDIIDFDYMNSELKDEYNARDYIDNINDWKTNFKEKYVSDEILSKFFDNKGVKLLVFYAVAVILLSIIFIIIALFNSTANTWAWRLGMTCVVMIIFVIILMGISNTVWGRWTVYGREYDMKWNIFSKYLDDFSLLEEHPPESVAIWNKYLVYATSLGVAKSVSDAMKKLVDVNNIHSGNDAYYFYSLGGYDLFSSTISTSNSTIAAANASDSGSIGSVGGGSGGGGGGAF